MFLAGTDYVPLVFDAPTCEEHWQIPIVVNGGIAHAAAEDNQSVIKNSRLTQSGHKIRKLGREEGFNDLKLADSIL